MQLPHTNKGHGIIGYVDIRARLKSPTPTRTQGYIIEYTTPAFRILPSSLTIARPTSAAEDDLGPWMVHEKLGPFTVEMRTASGVLVDWIDTAQNLTIAARLFAKDDTDISRVRLMLVSTATLGSGISARLGYDLPIQSQHAQPPQ